jgi:hydroxyacylglutathione hydrolase
MTSTDRVSLQLRVVPIETPSLGDRSYLVTDGHVALVVDPQRDIDRVLDLAEQLGVEITHVAETHLHNDYVTGGLALSRQTGAAYLVPAEAKVAFERQAVADGDVIEIGSHLALRVIATPGHTFHHVSYDLEADGQAVGVFTGGSLLFGSVGRTDLVSAEDTDALTHAQYGSAHRLADEMPGETAVYPTHGFGSFCSATQTSGDSSTIAAESRSNPALTQAEERFVAGLHAGFDAYPAYYAHMGGLNAAGPDGPDLSSPEPADPAELRRRLEAGEWVVDLRHRQAFAAGHLPGSFNFGLDGKLATYLGWLIPWGTPLTLLGESAEQVAEAQRELARIGIDRPAAAATGDPEGWVPGGMLGSFPTATFADLAAARRDGKLVILDVRRNQEWADSHIPEALHIPLHELLPRLGEVPEGRVWVHCASGYRASVAASILDASTRQVVAVDDDYDPNAASAGLLNPPEHR